MSSELPSAQREVLHAGTLRAELLRRLLTYLFFTRRHSCSTECTSSCNCKESTHFAMFLSSVVALTGCPLGIRLLLVELGRTWSYATINQSTHPSMILSDIITFFESHILLLRQDVSRWSGAGRGHQNRNCFVDVSPMDLPHNAAETVMERVMGSMVNFLWGRSTEEESDNFKGPHTRGGERKLPVRFRRLTIS